MVSISAQRRSKKDASPAPSRDGDGLRSTIGCGGAGGNRRCREGDRGAKPPPLLADDSGEYGRNADSAAVAVDDDNNNGVRDPAADKLNRNDASIFWSSSLSATAAAAAAANLDQSLARGDLPQSRAKWIFSGLGFSHA